MKFKFWFEVSLIWLFKYDLEVNESVFISYFINHMYWAHGRFLAVFLDFFFLQKETQFISQNVKAITLNTHTHKVLCDLTTHEKPNVNQNA